MGAALDDVDEGVSLDGLGQVPDTAKLVGCVVLALLQLLREREVTLWDLQPPTSYWLPVTTPSVVKPFQEASTES